MNPKGTVITKKEFKYTSLWPSNPVKEEDYRKVLAGKALVVIDIAVDSSSYLVFSKSEKFGEFLWDIDKRDTVGFLPVIKKNGVLVACSDNPLEQMQNEFEALMSQVGEEK